MKESLPVPISVTHYERVGLMKYFKGPSAMELTGPQMIAELDQQVLSAA